MLDDRALDVLFRTARSQNAWLDRPVSDGQLQAIHALLRMAPTSANSQPGRFVFLRSPEAKARLRPALSPGNVAKSMSAPVVVIVAHDTLFHEHLPRLFPHDPGAVDWFAGEANRAGRELAALRNGTLQGAYLMLAARAIGLDCGPMSGFDNARVDAEFFPDGRVRSNFLCGLGHGDPAGLFERGPRFEFDEVCQIL